MSRQLLRDLIWWGFLGVERSLRALGPQGARAVARGLAATAGAILPYERRLADAHLALAFPTWTPARRRRVRAAMFRHLGESAAELLHAERIVPTGVELEGVAAIEAALAEGRGAVVVTGHIGNWELMAAAVAQRGFPVTVIARRIYDARLDAWMRAWRARWGITTVVRDQRDAVKRMLRALREGHLLGILIDQDTDVPSRWVPFFGRLAKTPDAPVRLAARGVPVLVAADRRIAPGRHWARFERIALPDDPDAALARLSAALEARIREAPEQWVWFHRRWRTPPPETAAAAAANP